MNITESLAKAGREHSTLCNISLRLNDLSVYIYFFKVNNTIATFGWSQNYRELIFLLNRNVKKLNLKYTYNRICDRIWKVSHKNFME